MGRRYSLLWLLLSALVIAGAIAIAVRPGERPRYITVNQAVKAGDLQDVIYHADQGANLFLLDEAGYSLLHIAALHGRTEVADYLLGKGLDPDRRDPERTVGNCTALHLAARENRAQVAEVLIRAGAEVNALDARGRTPLHMAAMNDGADAARLLLEHRVRTDIRDVDDSTPLELAVRWEKERVGRVLVQHGAVR